MIKDRLKKAREDKFNKKNCIVAFLDILGFENHVQKYLNPEYPQDKDVLENIKFALEDAMKNIKEDEKKLLKYKMFSDCTSLTIPASEATMLCLLINLIKGYTFNLIRRNIYIRGGVSSGFHYEDENMIFSEALIKAHYLEKKADFPRTILDEDLVHRFKRMWINQKDTILEYGIEKRLITDEEGITFINPFNLMQSMDKDNLEHFEYLKGLNDIELKIELRRVDNEFNEWVLRNVRELIRRYKDDPDVLRKYLWLEQLLNWNIDPRKSKIKFEYLLK